MTCTQHVLYYVKGGFIFWFQSQSIYIYAIYMPYIYLYINILALKPKFEAPYIFILWDPLDLMPTIFSYYTPLKSLLTMPFFLLLLVLDSQLLTYSLPYFFVLSLWHACAAWHVPHSCLSPFPPSPHKPNSLNFAIYIISCFGATKGGWPLVVKIRKPTHLTTF